ncbi:hypothetical protein RZS08_43875, partial [Arthrospira platensis SPKY1]|nr:hypothetical protein [Arthrospira platensis SPKY1]
QQVLGGPGQSTVLAAVAREAARDHEVDRRRRPLAGAELVQVLAGQHLAATVQGVPVVPVLAEVVG